MKRTIFFKILSWYTFLIILFAALILIFSFRTIKNSYISSLSADLGRSGAVLKPLIHPLITEGKYAELDSLIKNIGRDAGLRITVIQPDGTVRADSERDPALMENHKGRPEIAAAMSDSYGESLRYSSTVEREMLYVAQNIKDGDRIIGVVRVSMFVNEINSLLSDLRYQIMQFTLLIGMISLIVSVIFLKGVSNPLRELAAAARRVAGGDFNTRVLLRKDDELKELAESFNYMTEKIKELFTELNNKKTEIQRIISNIHEGFAVLDRNDRIIIYNEQFTRSIGSNKIEGKRYWEVLRVPELDELLSEARKEKKNAVRRVEIGVRTYLCGTTFLPAQEEIILLLFDTTDVRDLEKVKRDLVSNVSHELKTPLTSIKGFVETLEEDESDAKKKEFFKIIRNNTNRLINIVNDLLVLSRLEEKRDRIEIGDVDMQALTGKIIQIFQQELQRKNINLSVEGEEKLPPIRGDQFMLEQMFVNLIDNAIKYSERGEIKISLRSANNLAKIDISDQGIGIPPEHLPRIFERFYVVDKSRSRASGGTGLGLSIVKHIVLLHRGTIDVESTVGGGTTFHITLPITGS